MTKGESYTKTLDRDKRKELQTNALLEEMKSPDSDERPERRRKIKLKSERSIIMKKEEKREESLNEC